MPGGRRPTPTSRPGSRPRRPDSRRPRHEPHPDESGSSASMDGRAASGGAGAGAVEHDLTGRSVPDASSATRRSGSGSTTSTTPSGSAAARCSARRRPTSRRRPTRGRPRREDHRCRRPPAAPANRSGRRPATSRYRQLRSGRDVLTRHRHQERFARAHPGEKATSLAEDESGPGHAPRPRGARRAGRRCSDRGDADRPHRATHRQGTVTGRSGARSYVEPSLSVWR